MFDCKPSLCFLKKTAFFLLISHSIAYSEIQPPSLEPVLLAEESAFSQFLTKNINITVGEFDRSIGTVDLFMMGDRHHYWKQIGIAGFSTIGGATGYRYLFKGDYPYQDWFLGAYGSVYYIAYKNKKPYHNTKWNAGLEVATARLQLTLNGYSRYDASSKDKKSSFEYRDGDLGGSLRLSTYFLQKMRMLGRINPFVFTSYTRFNAVEKNDKDQWVLDGGFGCRWELPSLLALEWKYTWNRHAMLKNRPALGLQLEFTSQRNSNTSYAMHRVCEMPQYYEPSYGYYSPSTDSKEDKEKEKKDSVSGAGSDTKSDKADSDKAASE